MAQRIILRPEVPHDLRSTADYLTENATFDVAERFVIGAFAAFRAIADMPGLGSPKPFGNPRNSTAFRSWPVEGFPNHLVYYQIADGAIVVYAIFHGSRDVATLLQKRRR